MKIARHIILGDYLPESRQPALVAARNKVVQAIQGVDHPRGSGTLSICPRKNAKHFPNGVTYLTNTYQDLMKGLGFSSQYRWPKSASILPSLKEDPRLQGVFENECGKIKPPGPIDFYKDQGGLRVGVEWETGYAGSFHRTMDRLFRGLTENVVDAAIVVVPDRALQMHCTDRVANFEEIEKYLLSWKIMQAMVGLGYLEIIAVSYDHLDEKMPYLKKQSKSTSKAKSKAKPK